MKALLLLGLPLIAIAAPAAAQTHSGHDMSSMPGMQMDGSPSQAQPAPASDPMPGMDMGQGHPTEHEDHAAPATEGASPAPSGTDLPAGSAPPPPVVPDRSADQFYGADAMAAAEARLMGTHCGMTYHQIMFNLAEYQARKGRDGYRWVGEGWFGGDIDRLVVKSEGEGAFHGKVEAAELQALYSRALDPYWNLQLGVRQDFVPGPARTYATIGVEGLAPYWFETEAALFLSNKGDLLARVEGYYDQRVTQRLILQPRAELNFAAQDVPENKIGAGLSNVELGLRLRYEIRREFAPYVGISWERKIGETARLARMTGDDVDTTAFVAGIRFWY